MATALFKHHYSSRTRPAHQYSPSQHIGYIERKTVTNYLFSHIIPKNKHAAIRWIEAYEQTLRKNARVIDKFIIPLPYEITDLDTAARLIKRYGFRITDGGRAPFRFTIQDWGTDNPHAHFVLCDRDVKTGKRVFGTTKLDSTERLKDAWQDTHNRFLADLGIEAEIIFTHNRQEQANDNARPVPEMALVAEEAVQANDNIQPVSEMLPQEEDKQPPDQLVPPHEMVSEHLPSTLPEPEPDAYVDEPAPSEPAMIVREGPQLLKGTLADLLDAARERTMLLTAVERRNAAWEAYRDAEEAFNAALGNLAAKTVAQTAAKNAEQAAQWRVDATHPGGKPKGFKLSLFGFSWKSPGYKQAEAAQAEHAARYEAYERASVDAYNAAQDLEAAGQEWQRRKETALQLTDHVKVYGNDDEVLEALATMQQTIRHVAEQIDFEELRAMFDSGEITREEYLAAVELMGEAQEIEQSEGQGQGQGY